MAAKEGNTTLCVHCGAPHGVSLTTNCSVTGNKYGVADCSACGVKLYYINRYIWRDMLGHLSVVGVERLMPRNQGENSRNKSRQSDEAGCARWMLIIIAVFVGLVVLGSLLR
jgi:hypothetical protein